MTGKNPFHHTVLPATAIAVAGLLLMVCTPTPNAPDGHTNHTGGVAPRVFFKKTAETTSIPTQVKTVELVVHGANFDTSARFDYSAKRGDIYGVPVGLVTLTVNGLDISGDTIYAGSATVAVEKDTIKRPAVTLTSTQPIVFIIMSPRDNDTVGSQSVTISGVIEAEYELLSFRMDNTEVPVVGGQWSRNVTLAEGSNAFAFLSVDKRGNIRNDTLTITYSAEAIDDEGPVLNVIQPLNGDTVGATQITVHGTASDVSGLQSVSVNGNTAALSGGAWSTVVTLTDGQNTIALAATDNSSNANVTRDTVVVTYSEQAVDSSAPNLSIDSPHDGDTVTASTVVVTGTASDISGVAGVSVNGATASLSGTQWTGSVSLSPGSNKIGAVATDNATAANVARDSIYVVYDPDAQDITPPSVAITSPSNNAVVSNAQGVTISGTASDASGISTVRVNGIAASYSQGSWSVSINLPSQGGNTVTAVAVDLKGNKDSTTITIVYDPTAADNTPPAITLVSHSSGQTVSSETVLIQVTASDANGIASVTIGGGAATLSSGKYQRSVTLTEGVNNLVAIAQDASSNHNRDTLEFTLEYSPHTVASAGMVLIPARDSTFLMGSNGGHPDEMPVHTVTFTYDFWMDTTEVTQGDYDALMSSTYTGYTSPAWRSDIGVGANNPAYYVNWYDAALYCNAVSVRDGLTPVYTYSGISGTPGNGCVLLGLEIDLSNDGHRLPTEAEWEYAARAGKSMDYYRVPDIGDYAWHRENGSTTSSQPVATKQPNAFGLYDMIGNIWEWCNDYYGSYPDGAQVDPTGANSSISRVFRGGSWGEGPTDQRLSLTFRSASYYSLWRPSSAAPGIGFRPVRSASPISNPPLKPTFTVHPASQTIVPGNPVSFSIVITDNPAFYKWQKNGVDLSGTNAATYSLASVAVSDAGSYRCIAENIAGIDTSSAAVLTVAAITVTDIDGNVYPTVTIGSQVWTTVNLRVTRYNDGTSIPHVPDSTQWSNLSTPGYCWYNNSTVTTEQEKWGALYNWYTVNTGKLAPAGWHVPTNAEWTTLENWLIANGYNYDSTTSGNNIAKSMAAITDWKSSTTIGAIGNNLGDNNRSGFSALPSGNRKYDTGHFLPLGYGGYWWSSTAYSGTDAYGRYILYNAECTSGGHYYKKYGESVRLVKD